MKIIITILAAIVIIDAVIVYACCVAASRADKTAQQIWRKKQSEMSCCAVHWHCVAPENGEKEANK